MNNDLISREALKKDIDFQYICKCCHNVNGNVCDICPISEIEKKIDNAPTVCGNNPKWCESCVSKGKCASTRPQGEWIEVKPHQSDLEDGIDYREECSICHEPNRHYGFDEYHDIRFATYYKTNFCPYCGAKMKGEEE